MRAGRPGGIDDVDAPIGEVGGENFIAASDGLELEVFRRNGSTGVLLDESACGKRTARDVPAEIGRRAKQVVPAADRGGLECELLCVTGGTGRLKQIREVRRGSRFYAKMAVCVLKSDDRTGGGRVRGSSMVATHRNEKEDRDSQKPMKNTLSVQESASKDFRGPSDGRVSENPGLGGPATVGKSRSLGAGAY